MGNIVVRHIKDLKANPENDPYNAALGDFDGPEGRRTLIPTAMHFFDIMVREAFAQGFAFHMWLFYLNSMVEAMVENYRPQGNVNLEAEFPIKYSLIIYDAFSILEDWITLMEHAPLDQPNAVFNSNEGDRSNIPKSGIVSIARCLLATIMSEHLEQKFKRLLANKVFRLYFRLCDMPGREDYARALMENIVAGGQSFNPDSKVYVSELYKIFSEELSEYRMSNAEEGDITRIDNALRAGL